MLKLGVIGLSEGNGHPYSWSSIFNGYNENAMEKCGFPVIPRYLEKQSWPECQLTSGHVEWVWSQNRKLSQQIADSTHIPNIALNIDELIQNVDAVLLARDDAENHLRYAKPVLEAGKPIYIDKPVATQLSALEELYKYEKYPGQIFTCSALRFSQELMLSQSRKASIGNVKHIVSVTPKSWKKYAVHIIEPVLNMLPEKDKPVTYYSGSKEQCGDGDGGSLEVIWSSGVKTTFIALGDAMSPISIRVFGDQSWCELTFTDAFTAFREALKQFTTGIEGSVALSPKSFNRQVVTLIERGSPWPKQY